MTTITTNVAQEINRHHAQASAKADQAVAHAVAAGKLLLEVRASLPHGGFLPWLAGHVSVSARQAQRYMAAAQGRPMPIRAPAKATPVSHSTGTEAATGSPCHAMSRHVTQGGFVPDTLSKWLTNPAFRPAVGYWHSASDESGGYWVVPSAQYPACFHVSRLGAEDERGGSCFDGTRQPVPGFLVERTLKAMGLAEPMALVWSSVHKAGLHRPFGEPEVIAAAGA